MVKRNPDFDLIEREKNRVIAESRRRRVKEFRMETDLPTKALSAEEAAAMAGISVPNFWDRLRSGTGPVVIKIGTRTLVLREDYDNWIRGLRQVRKG